MLGSWDAVTGAPQNEWCSSMIPYYYYHPQHQQGSPSLVLQPALVKGVAKFSKQNLLPFILGF